MNGEVLKIIKISELTSEVVGDRWLYQVLEHLNTFTLLECRSRQDISLIDVTHTLVLDHFDEAEKPATLLRQILNSACDVKTLVVVSTMPNFDSGDFAKLNFDLHIALGGEPKSPSTTNVVYVNDLNVAISLVKNSLFQAA